MVVALSHTPSERWLYELKQSCMLIALLMLFFCGCDCHKQTLHMCSLAAPGMPGLSLALICRAVTEWLAFTVLGAERGGRGLRKVRRGAGRAGRPRVRRARRRRVQVHLQPGGEGGHRAVGHHVTGCASARAKCVP